MDVSAEVAGTLRAESHGHPPCVMAAGFCSEHSAQSRGIGYEEECAPTLRAGVVPAAVYENHSQDTRYTGPLDTAPTVSATYGTGGSNQPFVVGLRTYDVRFSSEGTRNARQNVYETDTARTIDTGGNSPDSNQGGVAVVNRGYTVRRLSPTECSRLQGFPDWWCSCLDTPEPTEADIAFWTEVWETHRKIMGTSSRPRSRNQVIKWLQHPHSDSAEYKMWGNGVSLPCVFFVLAGIVWSTQMDTK